jgi:6-phosphogluconolactonase
VALFIVQATQAIADRGRFRVALAGGSTPRRAYELLAAPRSRTKVRWEAVDVFWGDERYVPPDDSASNYRMIWEALLQHVPLSAANIHRVPTEREPPEAAAAAYEDEIRKGFGDAAGIPRFDLILLGLGTNGHTASLFPNSSLLHKTASLVAADFVHEVDMWRITMTPPLLNQGRTVAFLVTGQEKAAVLRDILRGPHRPEALPAQLIRPVPGELLWIVDEAAASLAVRG